MSNSIHAAAMPAPSPDEQSSRPNLKVVPPPQAWEQCVWKEHRYYPNVKHGDMITCVQVHRCIHCSDTVHKPDGITPPLRFCEKPR